MNISNNLNLNEYFLLWPGASLCSWSSCHEGCTQDLFERSHVYVEYEPTREDEDVLVLADDEGEAGKLYRKTVQ